MSKLPKYFIIEAQALPEVYLKVAEAKQALELGEVQTINQAVRQVGISRSAFYKYKDAVRPFNDMLHGRIVTIQILLKDEPGNLSAILSQFAETGANILTINQSIPTSGRAAVTIAAETGGMKNELETLIQQIEQNDSVLRCEILAG
ncbi:MAG: ACT domain-containing protein [Oscillospiraceae bacterium]|nr:ACT domain-containing protein [Oscillospiraceae bacterium]